MDIKKELTQISSMLHIARGNCLLCAEHNRISVAFQPTQMEYDMITTSRSDLEVQMQKNDATRQS